MRNLNPGQLKVQSQMASRWWAQRIPYLLSEKNWKQGPTGKLRAPAVLYRVCLWARFLPTAAVEDWIPGWGSWSILPHPHSLPQCLVLKWHSDKSLLKGGGEDNLFVCFLLFWLHHAAYGFLVPWPRIKPVPCAVKTESLNHWTPQKSLFLFCFVLFCFVKGRTILLNPTTIYDNRSKSQLDVSVSLWIPNQPYNCKFTFSKLTIWSHHIYYPHRTGNYSQKVE